MIRESPPNGLRQPEKRRIALPDVRKRRTDICRVVLVGHGYAREFLVCCVQTSRSHFAASLVTRRLPGQVAFRSPNDARMDRARGQSTSHSLFELARSVLLRR